LKWQNQPRPGFYTSNCPIFLVSKYIHLDKVDLTPGHRLGLDALKAKFGSFTLA